MIVVVSYDIGIINRAVESVFLLFQAKPHQKYLWLEADRCCSSICLPQLLIVYGLWSFIREQHLFL